MSEPPARSPDYLERSHRYKNILRQTPSFVDHVTPTDVLNLVQIATFLRFNWTKGLVLTAADAANENVVHDVFSVYRLGQDGRPEQVDLAIRMRLEEGLGQDDNPHAGIWIPDMGVTKAHLLVGELWAAFVDEEKNTALQLGTRGMAIPEWTATR